MAERKYLGNYYDDEKGGYVKVYEYEYRKKKYTAKYFFPIPKEYTFEETEKIYVKKWEKLIKPILKEEYLNRIMKEIRYKPEDMD